MVFNFFILRNVGSKEKKVCQGVNKIWLHFPSEKLYSLPLMCHLPCSSLNNPLWPGRLDWHWRTPFFTKRQTKWIFHSRTSQVNMNEIGWQESFPLGDIQSDWRILQALAVHCRSKKDSVGETLVNLCLLSTAGIVHGNESQKKLSKISVFDNTIKRKIDTFSVEIRKQVLGK